MVSFYKLHEKLQVSMQVMGIGDYLLWNKYLVSYL